jgi:hypothetical protein
MVVVPGKTEFWIGGVIVKARVVQLVLGKVVIMLGQTRRSGLLCCGGD